MLQTADWTIPAIGGFLSESIEKEDRHLRQRPAPFEVQNVWDPSTLRGRPTQWKEVRSRPHASDATHNARIKLGLNSPAMPTDGNSLPCRSNMIAGRRTADMLAAMARGAELDAHATGVKPVTSFLTPNDLQSLRPSYSQNETCATETTTQLIGLSSKRVPVPPVSKHGRETSFPPDFVESSNQPNRPMVERARAEARSRARPWVTPSPPHPVFEEHTYARAGERSFFDTFRRGSADGSSAFCVRPGDVRIV